MSSMQSYCKGHSCLPRLEEICSPMLLLLTIQFHVLLCRACDSGKQEISRRGTRKRAAGKAPLLSHFLSALAFLFGET